MIVFSFSAIGGASEQDVLRSGQEMQEQHSDSINLLDILPRQWTDGRTAFHQIQPDEERGDHESLVSAGFLDNGEGEFLRESRCPVRILRGGELWRDSLQLAA